MVELIPDREFERVALPALISYRDAVPEAFVPPPLAAVRARARRGAIVRNAALAAATAGAVAAVIVGVAALPGLRHTTPPAGDRAPSSTPPTPSSSTRSPAPPSPTAPPQTPPSPTQPPTGGPTAALTMPTTWGGRTVVFPAPSGYQWCPQGPVTFPASGRAVVGNMVVGIDRTRATGDLTGDGQPEAVVYVYCYENSEFPSGDGSGHLMVITRDSAGKFTGLGHVGPAGENYPTVEVRDGLLIARIQQRYTPEVVQDRTYRWDGSSFKQVGGPTAFPT